VARGARRRAGDTGEYATYASGSQTRTEQALEEPAAALCSCEVFRELVKLITGHRSFLSSRLLAYIHHASGVRCSHDEFPLVEPLASFPTWDCATVPFRLLPRDGSGTRREIGEVDQSVEANAMVLQTTRPDPSRIGFTGSCAGAAADARATRQDGTFHCTGPHAAHQDRSPHSLIPLYIVPVYIWCTA
jgi:hypothetical protein